MSDYEKRVTPGQVSELRAAEGEGQAPRIAGYGAVFNARSELIAGSFFEVIAPGAFDDVLGDDVRGLFNHDPNYVLGRTTSKTLRIAQDERGLAYEIDPPNTQTHRDLILAPLARGDVTGSSFAFRVAADGEEWARDEDTGVVVRTITRFKRLFDVGPVTFPAYPDSEAAQRSLKAWQATQDGLHVQAINQRSARERLMQLLNV